MIGSQVPDLIRRLNAMNPERRAGFAQVLGDCGPSFGVYPLSTAQRQIWLAEQLHPGSPVYHTPHALLLHGAVDSEALATAFDEVVGRHEALRVAIFDINGNPWQTVVEPSKGVLRIEEMPPGADLAEAARACAAAEVRRPFALAEGRLLRARLVRCGADCALLLVTVHHVAADGVWSMRVFFSEVVQCYESLVRNGRLPDLPAPPNFGELLLAHREYANRRVTVSAKYWEQELAGAPTLLELPLDRTRPAESAARGAVAELSWPAEQARRVRSFANEARVTPFVVLFAAFAGVLHRHTAADDLLIGLPVANRDGIRSADAVGLFTNTVVLRSRALARTSFQELVAQSMKTLSGALRHQEFPFESLVTALHPERSPSHHPVYQVLCGMRGSAAGEFALPGVDVQPVTVHAGTSMCDLSLTYVMGEESLSCWVEYDADLFDSTNVERLLDHLRRFLDGALAQPDAEVGALPMLSAAERGLLLGEWSSGGTVTFPGKLPAELFELQVDRTPEAVAASCGDTSLTYRELDRAANRLAHVLREHGVGPETLVGIQLKRSVDMAISVLAIWKAGGAYLPLDVQHPPARRAAMLEDSGARIVIATEWQGDQFATGTTVVGVSQPDASCERISPVGRTDNLAYVMYTSGSTGRPKGVAVPLSAVLNLREGLNRVSLPGPGDRVLQFASLGFDASVGEFLMALTNGAELVFAPREELQPGPEMEEMINRRGVTAAILSPTVLSMTRPERVPNLKTLLVGSEMVPPRLAFNWSRGRRLWYVYGPTETTLISVAAPCVELEQLAPIGRPLPNEEAYVLDSGMNPVPAGVRGELYIGGQGVSRGYITWPAMTARQFVPDPFSGRPGARLYRTGDVVRFRADGTLECFGRADNQVKIRGIRIELGEIQHHLVNLPQVRSGAVVTREFGPGDLRLIAYIVPAEPGPLNDRELRQALRAELPEYMIPARFVAVREMPQTNTGKTDYQAFERLALPDATGTVDHAGPADDLERIIADAWCRTLQVDAVGVDENFFDLGGNSLLVSRVAAILTEELAMPLSVLTLLRNPTVRRLAEQLGDGEAAPVGRSERRESTREARRRSIGVRARRNGGRTAEDQP